VWEADADTFEFSFVSEQAERILGYPTERWVREPTFWSDHLHPDDRDWAVRVCQEATAQKCGHDFEYRMIAADGRIVWLRDMVTVVV
ncbi:PAS domain-containing protein, partial [Klebsiella pneumoniae]|uniref:PAS domain-containing protein n=1 Tax=Klebsiella pneumoniae TaxID=573 RepID=UPI003013CDD2